MRQDWAETEHQNIELVLDELFIEGSCVFGEKASLGLVPVKSQIYRHFIYMRCAMSGTLAEGAVVRKTGGKTVCSTGSVRCFGGTEANG